MVRVLVIILGVLAVGVAVVGLVARYVPIRNDGLLVVAAASPYLMAAGPVGVILLGLGRLGVPTALAVCLCVVIVGVQLPPLRRPRDKWAAHRCCPGDERESPLRTG